MIKILILSVGTNANYHVAKIFKEKFRDSFFIVGVDINESYLVPSIIYLDSFYKVPSSADSSYFQTILNLCKRERIDVILPSFDIDQKLFYPENSALVGLGIYSLGVPYKSLEMYDNKENMIKFLQKNNIDIPYTFSLSEIEDTKKYFLKPKNGVASQGIKIEKGIEIKKYKENKNLLIQEICQKPEVTLECFYYDGTLNTIARERIETKSGVCTKAHVYHDEQLQEIALNFVKKIETPIYFNLQFMKNSKNRSVITDVNLRLAGGMSLSHAAGWDEASAIANVLLGKSKEDILCCFNLNATEQFIVRAYTDIVTKKII